MGRAEMVWNVVRWRGAFMGLTRQQPAARVCDGLLKTCYLRITVDLAMRLSTSRPRPSHCAPFRRCRPTRRPRRGSSGNGLAAFSHALYWNGAVNIFYTFQNLESRMLFPLSTFHF